MTVATERAARATNGNGTRRPVVVAIPRAELVGSLMDVQALATEGMDAVGEGLRAVERLCEAVQGTSPRIKAIEHALIAIYDHQVRLLHEATVLAGRYDGATPRPRA